MQTVSRIFKNRAGTAGRELCAIDPWVPAHFCIPHWGFHMFTSSDSLPFETGPNSPLLECGLDVGEVLLLDRMWRKPWCQIAGGRSWQTHGTHFQRHKAVPAAPQKGPYTEEQRPPASSSLPHPTHQDVSRNQLLPPWSSLHTRQPGLTARLSPHEPGPPNSGTPKFLPTRTMT